MKYNNVYTIDEEHSHRFYQVPKELFIDEYYREMNSDSKVLYSVLLDRKELSRKNNWVDKHGQVYLIYTRSNLAELLGISVRSIQRAFNILKELDLIKEERQGLNKPNKIYICRTKSHVTQGYDNLAHQEMHNWHTSDTDISETENKRYIITSNDDYVFHYYHLKYKSIKGKEHPTVTKTQLENMQSIIDDFRIEYDTSNEEWKDAIDEHFDELPSGNNGNILSFISGTLEQSPLLRYLMIK